MVRSKLGYMHELPDPPDYHSNLGNCSLDPNLDRHDKPPMVVTIGNWFYGASKRTKVQRILEVSA
ncbi:hypothetical protein IIN26_001045 [Escherichia coli]|nr:hypothetical protein [Escherichia coli]